MKLISKFILCLSILGLCSCAMLGLSQDKGMKGLLYAKSEITNLAEQYETIYQGASVIAQLNWQQKIDPLFIQAEQILNQWDYYLKIGKDPNITIDEYLKIKNEIIKMLFEIKEG